MKFLSALALVLVASGLGFYLWWSAAISIPQTSVNTTFVITQGESATQIISDLRTKNLVRSTIATKIFLKLNNLENQLRPGSYKISQSMDLKSLFALFSKGPADIWVTIPEGWRREQIADRMAANIPGFSKADFVKETATLEGQLFPDTYLIPVSATPSDVVKILHDNFLEKTSLIMPRDKEVLILASLVEREAKSDPDRAIIAGILKKRLEADWLLQIDATVQYAAGSWQPIYDTKLPSIYNTYLHSGLPPTPIANPGLAAINAVRNPQSSTYWYYLTGSDGVTYYAATLAGHNLNIDKYLSH